MVHIFFNGRKLVNTLVNIFIISLLRMAASDQDKNVKSAVCPVPLYVQAWQTILYGKSAFLTRKVLASVARIWSMMH